MNSRESQKNAVCDEMIMNRIYVLRGQKVMIDMDLAELYQIDVSKIRMLTEKKPGRFPGDFMFHLNLEDYDSLRHQDSTVIRNKLIKDFPIAFTEQGLAMLAGLFRSARAIGINITIIRIFTLIRQIIPDYPELNREMMNFNNNFTCHK